MEVGTRDRRKRSRRRRRRRLIVPLALLAAAAVAVVLVIDNGPGHAERQLVTSYVRAWSAGDYHKMYSLLDPASRGRLSEARFAAAYRRDATVATLRSITPARLGPKR